jgi:hypothetical protein
MRDQPHQAIVIGAQVIGHYAFRYMFEYLAELRYMSRLYQKFHGIVSTIFSHSQRNVYSQLIWPTTDDIFYFTDKQDIYHIRSISILVTTYNRHPYVQYAAILTRGNNISKLLKNLVI